jgi:hypothetical protein
MATAGSKKEKEWQLQEAKKRKNDKNRSSNLRFKHTLKHKQ